MTKIRSPLWQILHNQDVKLASKREAFMSTYHGSCGTTPLIILTRPFLTGFDYHITSFSSVLFLIPPCTCLQIVASVKTMKGNESLGRVAMTKYIKAETKEWPVRC